MVSRRQVMAGATTASLTLKVSSALAAAPTPHTIKEFLIRPAVRDAALSPNGELTAVLHRGLEQGKPISYILVHKSKVPDAPPFMIHLGSYDVQRVRWGNDERLLIWALVHIDASGGPAGVWYRGEFVLTPSRRVLAMDADGGNSVLLFGEQPDLLRTNYDLGDLTDVLLDDPRHVLMQVWDGRHRRGVLQKVDIYSGVGLEAERGVYDTLGWLTQNGVPVLRYDVGAWRTVNVFARAPGEKDWKFFRKFRRNELQKLDGFDMVGSTDDAGVVLVATRPADEEFQVIQKLDIRTLQFGEVFAKRSTDLISLWSDGRDKPLATAYLEDRVNYSLLHASFEPHYRRILQAFDADCNIALGQISLDRKRLLIIVSGPRTPPEHWRYDTETLKLKLLGKSMPWLAKDRLAGVETLKVMSRDGVAIPAYLTVPIDAPKGHHPLVVMPHGGPELRDALDFDAFAQALAAQGWLVLQPNFRGSGGYGRTFADAGRRRWGDRMQEDVEDCVDALIKAGRADPARVAIFGASYGGYAALMGAVRKPELYKAIVSVAGPSNLIEFLAASRRDSGADSPSYLYWLKTIGDPKTDRPRLEAASPALRASEIKAPVLLIHGSADDVVPPKQSELMKTALLQAGRVVDHIELKREGHSGWSEATTGLVLQRTVDHIAKAFKA